MTPLIGNPAVLYRVDDRGALRLVRVTRTTTRRVYVLAADLFQENAPPIESAVLRMRRRVSSRRANRNGAAFERSVSLAELIETGAAWCAGGRVLLMTEDGAMRVLGLHGRRAPSRVPVVDSSLRALGLDGTATADDVKRAFRLRARECHPDVGGSHAVFVALQAAFTRALAATRREV